MRRPVTFSQRGPHKAHGTGRYCYITRGGYNANRTVESWINFHLELIYE